MEENAKNNSRNRKDRRETDLKNEEREEEEREKETYFDVGLLLQAIYELFHRIAENFH